MKKYFATAAALALFIALAGCAENNKPYDDTESLSRPQSSVSSMEEVSTGMYEMTDILYGGVLVKESKAPEGFLLDENAYYVEITENGKTYEVENEAGKGFVNRAQTGSLRIEKTSSDKKVEGFTFRVQGANGYDKTFVTDAKGEIHVEGAARRRLHRFRGVRQGQRQLCAVRRQDGNDSCG